MATNTGFTAHETLNVHEALRCAAVGLAKMEMMRPVVNDADLKRFVDQEINSKKKELEQLENFAHKIIP